jgi:hypothetical protein
MLLALHNQIHPSSPPFSLVRKSERELERKGKVVIMNGL